MGDSGTLIECPVCFERVFVADTAKAERGRIIAALRTWIDESEYAEMATDALAFIERKFVATEDD